MKKLRTYLTVLFMLCVLTGCSAKEDDSNSIYINKKNEIVGTIVEDFSKDYYSEDELKSLVNESAAEYNSNGEKIKIDKFEVKNSTARLVTEYSTSQDYADFNGVDFFYGTISEAVDAGYEFEQDFISSDDESAIAATIIKSLSNYHIVIYEENLTLKLDKKILFASENLSLDGNKKAVLSEDSEGLAYVVFE